MSRIKVESSVVSHRGWIRKTNQDYFLLNGASIVEADQEKYEAKTNTREKFQVYGVFDGMGGTVCGETAAIIGAQVAKYYKQRLLGRSIDNVEKYLKLYFKDANEAICHMIDEKKIEESGSTAAVIWLYDGIVYGANVGDTRIYLFRDNELKQLSVDHTQQALFSKMNLCMEANERHKSKHMLTQYLGINGEEMVIEPHCFKIQPKHKDILLICSDGLYEKLSDEMIQEILRSSTNIEKAQQALLQQALNLQSKDNITAMLLQVYKTLF